VAGNRPLGVVLSSRSYVNGRGWVTSKAAGRTIKAVGFLGFVGAGIAIVTVDDYEQDYQSMVEKMAAIDEANDPHNRRLAAVEAVEAMNRYLSHFVPDDTVLNGSTYYALLAVLTEE